MTFKIRVRCIPVEYVSSISGFVNGENTIAESKYTHFYLI
jgi:hypothetical protein